MRAAPSIPSLRSAAVFPLLRRALGRATRANFRVLQFSVQTDHVHLIIEADSPSAFERGMRGLTTRSALAVQRALRKGGKTWERRFHAHELGTPTEVRNAMTYVLLNFRKHLRAPPGIDPRSSAVWFEDWVGRPDPRDLPRLVAAPQTWLGSLGWKRGGGRLRVEDAPRTPARRRR